MSTKIQPPSVRDAKQLLTHLAELVEEAQTTAREATSRSNALLAEVQRVAAELYEVAVTASELDPTR